MAPLTRGKRTNMSLGIKGLDELLAEMKAAPELYRPSAFWDELTAIALKQIESAGFENFKRTVNMTYFNWGVIGILQHQLLPVLLHWCRKPRFQMLGARFPGYRSQSPRAHTYYVPSNYRLRLREIATFNPLTAILYKIYVAMLWEYVAERDTAGLLAALDEPAVGNPFIVEYAGRKTSQDLCNSVHEFYSAGGVDFLAGARDVAEIGGGYGRLAYVFLKAAPAATVCLIDIAPALNVAQEYMSRVFPGETIFYFRPFNRFEDVRREFEASRIRFLAAHQIEALPPKKFDLIVNVSSFHEMSGPQVDNYFSQIDRLCRGRFYTKQWRVSQAKVNGLVMREFDYPVPPWWKAVYHRQHPIQRLFFEALYEVAPRPA